MSPPTEQLIRDYLNRLSVAARSQLGPDDRRALVTRTRDFIERKTGFAGPPTAIEVASLLAGLGDPARLVEQERQRLAAVRGAMPEPAAARNPITRVLRRDSVKARGASWHWPVLEGSRTDLQLRLLDSGEQQADTQAATGSNGLARNGVSEPERDADSGSAAPPIPPPPREPDWFMLSLGAAEPDLAGDEQAPDPAAPATVADGGTDPGTRQFADAGLTALGAYESAGTTPDWQLTTPRDPVFSRHVRRALSAGAAWYRRSPVEASAVVLLGLGGAIYPPVWLLGAVVALTSRMWDYRDKWLGLALPLLLTVIAVVVGVTRGGHVSMGQGVHEGWVYGVVASRIAAVLGACYLGWRSVHGRRPPAVPPWNRPHKIG